MLTNDQLIEYYQQNANEAITKEEKRFWQKGADLLAGRRKPDKLPQKHHICYRYIRNYQHMGYKQTEIARLLNIHHGPISRIVRGKRIADSAYDHLLKQLEPEHEPV